MSGGLALALLAAGGAGLVNALAGGGTLLLFPALLALGLPAVAASVHSTVALCPGYLGATLAQAPQLAGQRRRARVLGPAAALGGAAGAVLLLHTGEAAFRGAVPWLLLTASVLLGLQEPLRARWLRAGSAPSARAGAPLLLAFPLVTLACVYGGYFGAGLSVLLLALLGILLHEDFGRLNALKQLLALAANLAAAALFVFRAPLQGRLLVALALAALAGGWLGGRLAGRLPPARLRGAVVALGLLLTLYYFMR